MFSNNYALSFKFGKIRTTEDRYHYFPAAIAILSLVQLEKDLKKGKRVCLVELFETAVLDKTTIRNPRLYTYLGYPCECQL